MTRSDSKLPVSLSNRLVLLRQIRELALVQLRMALVRNELYLAGLAAAVISLMAGILTGHDEGFSVTTIPVEAAVVWFLLLHVGLVSRVTQGLSRLRQSIWPLLILANPGFLGICFSGVVLLLGEILLVALAACPGFFLLSVMLEFDPLNLTSFVPVVIAFVFLGSSMAFLGGMLFRSAYLATIASFLMAFVLYVIPLSLASLGPMLFKPFQPPWWIELSRYGRIWFDLSPGGAFQFPHPLLTRPWLSGVVTMLALMVSVPFLLAGRWLFDRRQSYLPEPRTLGGKTRSVRATPRMTSRKGGVRPRCWSNALVWKEFTYTAGGRRGMIVRCIVYAIAPVGVILVDVTNADPTWCMFFGILTGIGFVLETLYLTSSVISAEEDEGMMSQLLVLPLTARELLLEKLRGSVLGVLPGATATLLTAGIGLLSYYDWRLGRVNWTWTFLVSAELLTHFALLIGLVLVVTMANPRQQEGIRAGCMAVFGIVFCEFWAYGMMTWLLGMQGSPGVTLAYWTIQWILIAALTVWLWRKIPYVFESACYQGTLLANPDESAQER